MAARPMRMAGPPRSINASSMVTVPGCLSEFRTPTRIFAQQERSSSRSRR